ncbi:MAG: GAF domain-containing protein, partial [Chloroflexi bacterium]|nr:GAF domain-containing protein [Chloroflexota bacterium]
MERLGADVAVPLLFKDELLGILLVGPKRSGAIFTEEDITLLSTLANQAAIALRNGQLYHEIQSSHEYTQAILERLDSAVITVDSKADPVVANEAAGRLLPDRHGKLLLPPLLRTMVQKVFRTGEEQPNLEFDLLDRNGQSLPVIATVCPFLSESGQVESALIVIRDISALRRLEDERLRVERLSSISRVAATLAHEIRNPLASIKTFCQLLPEKYLDDEFRETFSQISLEEVNRIDALVGTLLSVEKPAIGLKERVKVQDAITSTLKLIEPLARENDLSVDFKRDENIPDIVGDNSQLRQLFLNLLLNAREAASSGTALEVKLFHRPDMGIVVDIINQGTPIAPEILAHLFEPFFTTKERGTGLGLTVCKQVAEFHGGSLSASSKPDGETTFRLTLPAAFQPTDEQL